MTREPTEMELKVARNLLDYEAAGQPHTAWDDLSPGYRNVMIGKARAAIRAMGEPTKEMVLAGCAKAAEEQLRPISINRRDAADLWRAMIDAASPPE